MADTAELVELTDEQKDIIRTVRDFVDKEVLANKSIYPDQATMARLFTVTGYDQAIQKIVTREWTRVKTGK